MRGFCPLRGAIPSVALVSTCVGQDAGSEDNSHPQAQRTLSLVKNLILWLTHYTRAGRATVVRGSRQRLGACVVLPSCRIHTDMAMFCSWVWLAFISHWVFSLIATPPLPRLCFCIQSKTVHLSLRGCTSRIHWSCFLQEAYSTEHGCPSQARGTLLRMKTSWNFAKYVLYACVLGRHVEMRKPCKTCVPICGPTHPIFYGVDCSAWISSCVPSTQLVMATTE